jgi:hypothetical protein
LKLTESEKYFFEVYYPHEFHHGGVGNKDIESILKKDGYIPIRLPERFKPINFMIRLIAMASWVWKIKSNSLVAFQFPVYPRMFRILLYLLAKKKVNLLVILSDIDGLKTDNQQLLKKELKLLKLCTHFVVHGGTMERWLLENLSEARTAKIARLGPFDFLATPYQENRVLQPSICFAGNLSKSGFLVHLPQSECINYHLYGEDPPKGCLDNTRIHYHGVYNPYGLPSVINGSFGLIWDGEGANGPSGAIGNYQQYIFPHKLSLYILAGMPVIGPDFGGSAEFIRSMGIGWLINSLEELPELLPSIDEISYQHVRKNILSLQQEIYRGEHLTGAINKLIRT